MVACPRCGHENADDARFCQACGAELRRAAPAEERKLVSALFVDLVGSTARAEQADPEVVREELRWYHERARAELERFGGTVEKFIGDAVVAIFGAPIARGDDAERAVRAGLRVLEAIDELNEEHPGLSLQARVAVNTGEALVTVSARPELGEAFATGDVINTAARLQGAAPPGRLIVGQETYRATRRAVRYEEVGPVDAKGKREPVPAWLAIGEADQAPVPTDRTPLIGRDRETEQLASVWSASREHGRPSVVTILGPPGIGKSRLSRGFLRGIEGDGGVAVTGRCLPYEEVAGYPASAEQLRSIAGILESDPPEAARSKLAACVASFLPDPEVADVTRYLSLLLGLGVDDPTDDRTQLFYAMRRFVEGWGAAHPGVLRFEDLHWAGAGQLELIDHLVARVRDVPVVFLLLSRPEAEAAIRSWGAGVIPQWTIPLGPVSAADASAIATAVLGAGAAVDRIVEVCDGNPLFIEELAASMSDRLADGQQLPTAVREAIASRIDLLPAEPRAALLDASVIGHTFWRGVLAAVRPDPDLETALDALEVRDLIHREPRSQVAGDIEFSFRHMLIREVAYGTLPKAIRRERHAGIAAYIEEHEPERRRELSWLLAHHWREAGEAARAVEYLLISAERAAESWASDEALALLNQALELAAADPDSSDRVRLRRAMLMVELGAFETVAAEINDILPRLRGTDAVEALLVRGWAATWLEDPEVREIALHALAAAEALGDQELIAAALACVSLAGINDGTLPDAVATGERALELRVPGSRPSRFVMAEEAVFEAAYWMGDYARSEELSRHAFDVGGATHAVEPLVRGGAWHGLTLLAMGRTEEGLAMLDRIIATADELDVPRWGAAPLNYSSLAFRDLYLVEEARRRNEAALAFVQAHGEWGMPLLQGRTDLLLADLMAGDVGAAQAGWPEVWDAAINGAAWRPWLGGCRLSLIRARIAREAEGPDATAGHALDAIARAQRATRPKYEAAARTLLGEAFVSLGRREDGLTEVRAATEIAERLGGATPRWQTWAARSRIAYATGDDDDAAAAAARAREILQTWLATLTAEHAASVRGAPEPAQVLAGG
ncbi:MAG TPA: AAA family ATPase [Actinomycetota bacterium]|nr:AAA family ATPase [Actinomycetota bacterium]